MATRLARTASQCATRAGSHLTASTSAVCTSYAAIHAWNACFVRRDSNAASSQASLSLISRNLMLDTLDLVSKAPAVTVAAAHRCTSRMGRNYLQFTYSAWPYKIAFTYMAYLVGKLWVNGPICR